MLTLTRTYEKNKLTRKSLEAIDAPQMPIVYKRQILQSNNTCTSRHDKENNLL